REHGGVGLLAVRGGRRGEEAGPHAAGVRPSGRVERRLRSHRERVLVIVRHGALATAAPTPDLRETLARQPVVRHVACDAAEPDRALRHLPRPPSARNITSVTRIASVTPGSNDAGRRRARAAARPPSPARSDGALAPPGGPNRTPREPPRPPRARRDRRARR